MGMLRFPVFLPEDDGTVRPSEVPQELGMLEFGTGDESGACRRYCALSFSPCLGCAWDLHAATLSAATSCSVPTPWGFWAAILLLGTFTSAEAVGRLGGGTDNY